MNIPKVNILESYTGQDAINWVIAHTVTQSTPFNNEELFHEPIQFHQYESPGKIAFYIPTRFSMPYSQEQHSAISFMTGNVVGVTVFEYPQHKGCEIETVVELNNGASLSIITDHKRKFVEVRAYLDEDQEV